MRNGYKTNAETKTNAVITDDTTLAHSNSLAESSLWVLLGVLAPREGEFQQCSKDGRNCFMISRFNETDGTRSETPREGRTGRTGGTIL